MSGLVMSKQIVCDYCYTNINYIEEPIVETRIFVRNKLANTQSDFLPTSPIIEVTHRKCWVDMNKIVKDILKDNLDRPAVDKNHQIV